MVDNDRMKFSHIDKLFKDADGFKVATMMLNFVLMIPERLGFSVAHKSSVSQSLPGKPEVFQMKTHIRFARKREDAAFVSRKMK